MNKDLNYYVGWLGCLLVALVLTPIYFAIITIIRLFVVIVDIIFDTFTFMPKALYEYERASLKSYWEKEKERIFKDIKKD